MVEEVLAAKDMIIKEIFSANDGFTLQERNFWEGFPPPLCYRKP